MNKIYTASNINITVTISLDTQDLETIARDIGSQNPTETQIKEWIKSTVLAGLVDARFFHKRYKKE